MTLISVQYNFNSEDKTECLDTVNPLHNQINQPHSESY